MMIGARHAMLVEPDSLTVTETYKVQWRQPKTDLCALAKLRWIEKWSVNRLAEHLGKSPETIQMYLCRMRKPGGLDSLKLSPEELSSIRDNINQVFQGV